MPKKDSPPPQENNLASSLIAMQAGLEEDRQRAEAAEKLRQEKELADARAQLEKADEFPDHVMYLEGAAGELFRTRMRQGIDARDIKEGELEKVEPLPWKEKKPSWKERAKKFFGL